MRPTYRYVPLTDMSHLQIRAYLARACSLLHALSCALSRALSRARSPSSSRCCARAHARSVCFASSLTYSLTLSTHPLFLPVFTPPLSFLLFKVAKKERQNQNRQNLDQQRSMKDMLQQHNAGMSEVELRINASILKKVVSDQPDLPEDLAAKLALN